MQKTDKPEHQQDGSGYHHPIFQSPSSLSPVQGLPFDNGPNQRIDIGFPDSG
jgi:hypothetical protein